MARGLLHFAFFSKSRPHKIGPADLDKVSEKFVFGERGPKVRIHLEGYWISSLHDDASSSRPQTKLWSARPRTPVEGLSEDFWDAAAAWESLPEWDIGIQDLTRQSLGSQRRSTRLKPQLVKGSSKRKRKSLKVITIRITLTKWWRVAFESRARRRQPDL